MSDFEKLINANDLIEWIVETYPDWCIGAVRSIVDHVENMPSAEPDQSDVARAIATIIENEKDMRVIAQIVRKGKWVDARDGYDAHVKCTGCFKTYDWTSQAQYYNFCPNCGADMRGEHD